MFQPHTISDMLSLQQTVLSFPLEPQHLSLVPSRGYLSIMVYAVLQLFVSILWRSMPHHVVIVLLVYFFTGPFLFTLKGEKLTHIENRYFG